MGRKITAPTPKSAPNTGPPDSSLATLANEMMAMKQPAINPKMPYNNPATFASESGSILFTIMIASGSWGPADAITSDDSGGV